MTDQEKDTLYSVLMQLIDGGETLTKLERRDLINQLTAARCDMTAADILSATENNRKLRIKRGTTAQNDAYTGLSGELLMDVDTNTLRIHDGETPGGHVVSGGGTGGGFATTDLSNISDTGRSVISALCIPDYSAPVAQTWDAPHQAEYDSLVVYKTNHTSGDASVEVFLSSNGNDFFSLKASNAGSGSLMICGDFVVPCGYYWKIIGGRNVDRKLTVYPILGGYANAAA